MQPCLYLLLNTQLQVEWPISLNLSRKKPRHLQEQDSIRQGPLLSCTYTAKSEQIHPTLEDRYKLQEGHHIRAEVQVVASQSSSARLKTLLLVTMTIEDSSWPGLADGDAVNLSAINTLSTTLSCLGIKW